MEFTEHGVLFTVANFKLQTTGMKSTGGGTPSTEHGMPSTGRYLKVQERNEE